MESGEEGEEEQRQEEGGGGDLLVINLKLELQLFINSLIDYPANYLSV